VSLASNTKGNINTAVGDAALASNTIGGDNTATGVSALVSNTEGESNTANGAGALDRNTTGAGNVATGAFALESNITGSANTANGYNALGRSTASNNTAIGESALANDTNGASNTAIGIGAGLNQTTGSNNVYIGAEIHGVAGESDACRIASIYGATITGGTEVFINSDNRLGTITSSKRFKRNITPTSGASEVLYELQPVTFRYKKEIDPEGRWQFGLVAEDVEKVNPALVVRDKDGKPYSVRYDQVNAMLLSEFLKEHRKVEKLEAALDTITKRLNEQEARIQKVCAEIEVSELAAKTALNSQ
jgi:hypothetical protein